jgi:hypothetical protein
MSTWCTFSDDDHFSSAGARRSVGEPPDGGAQVAGHAGQLVDGGAGLASAWVVESAAVETPVMSVAISVVPEAASCTERDISYVRRISIAE